MTASPEGVPPTTFPILTRLQAQAPPPLLFHYTRRAALLGILSTKTLHASSARYLNDAQELSTATLIASTVLDQRRPPTPGLAKLHSLFRAFLAGAAQRDAGVFSMSNDGGDVRAEWRGYVQPGEGYAMRCDRSALAGSLR